MTTDQGRATTEIDQLLEPERAELLAVLAALDDAQWGTPSLCTGWTVRHVVVHLLMPYELTVPRFLAAMVRRRFAFDRVAYDWAVRDRRSAHQLIEALRRTADRKFNVPGAPAEAPLSHLVCHSEDIYRPLDVRREVRPASLNRTLDQLTSPRARGLRSPGLLDGIALATDDTGWTYGDGATAVGSASALITTLAGRSAALDELTGDGAHLVRARLGAS